MKTNKEDRKRMRPKKYATLSISITSILLVLLIIGYSVMNYWYVVIDNVLGGGQLVVESAKGADTWDTDYYGKAASSKEQIEEEARSLAVEVEEEGIVLLKNENDSLPLSIDDELAVFGWGFQYPVYSGTGSGAMSAGSEITPQMGLEDAGFKLNQKLIDTYSSWSEATGWTKRPDAGMYMGMANEDTQDWQIPEMELMNEAKSAAESASTAIFWITRQGGEAVDLPMSMGKETGLTEASYGYNPDKHYLELSDEEEQVLSKIEESFDNIVVIINSSNAMELGELENDEKVNAILWIGGAGQVGFEAVGEVLSGQVNPSGRLVDTFYADFLADPTAVNFSDPSVYSGGNATVNVYSNVSDENALGSTYFVDYEEGIYVGYRYYETRFGNDEAEYLNQVVYPFGYGLSYTDFEQTLDSVTYDSSTGIVTVKGTVTNIGSLAGKEVVQIYYGAPYYADGSRIEKATKNLIGYTKVSLEAGESTEFIITFNDEDMASYDEGYYTENGSYVLEAGTYQIYLGKNAHDSWDSTSFEVASTLVYADQTNTSEAVAVGKRTTDLVIAENSFEESLVGSNLSTVMSQSDWEGTYPTTATDDDRIASAELIERLKAYESTSIDTQSFTTGAENGVTLLDLRGLEYDDPLWEEFLDQLTVEEMTQMVFEGGFQIHGIDRLGVPESGVNDGPAALKTKGVGTEETSKTLTCWPTEVVIASTWNSELASKIGETVGQEGLQYNMNGWYAPGLNTHRSPFAGRNFEYFSEDPYLAGTICEKEVSGAAKFGLACYVKHFALNDQESYRNDNSSGAWKTDQSNVMLCTWATEQTIREIYLKPFEYVVKNAQVEIKYISDAKGTVSTKTMQACTGIMSSFNYVGNTWAGGNEELLTDVLSDEWGFVGTVITDAAFFGYMNKNQMIAAGGNLNLTTSTVKADSFDTTSTDVVNDLREACHGICYTVAHSNAVNGISPGDTIKYSIAPWRIAMMIAIGVMAALFVFALISSMLRFKDAKENPEKYKLN